MRKFVATAPKADRSIVAGVTTLCLVQFVDVLGVTVVVTALPAMLRDLHAPADAGALVAAAYAMCFGGLLMFGARLGDRFGHRRIILAGTTAFGAAAGLSAAAGSVEMLAAARCVQGAAAALAVPAALRLLTTMTPDGQRRRMAVAAWSAAGAAAGATGFVVGGVVTDLLSWRAAYWGYLPLAVALSAAVIRTVPRDRVGPGAMPLNLSGSALFTLAAMAFIVATTLLPADGRAPAGVAALAGALILFTGFVVVDRRAAAPLLPRSLLRQPPVRGGTLGAFLNTFTTSSAVTLATLYLQNTLGRSPLSTALLLLPFSLAVIGGSALASLLLARCSPQQVIAAGLGAITVFNAALIVAVASTWALPLVVAVGGAGIGMSSVAATSLGTGVTADARSAASGILNTGAQVGTAVGIAVLLLVAALANEVPARHSSAPGVAWMAAAAASLIGALLFTIFDRTTSAAERPESGVARSR